MAVAVAVMTGVPPIGVAVGASGVPPPLVVAGVAVRIGVAVRVGVTAVDVGVTVAVGVGVTQVKAEQVSLQQAPPGPAFSHTSPGWRMPSPHTGHAG